MTSSRSKLAGVLAVATVLAAGGMMAMAGPPMICHPVEVECKSLPMKGDGQVDPSFDASNLAKETLKILKTQEPTLARMETLRRASLYARENKRQGHDLLARLAWIALDAEASGKTQWARNAWYDAGYLAACYQQLGVDIDWKPGFSDGIQGYAWIKKALSFSEAPPEMHYGAALATTTAMRDHKILIDGQDAYNHHLQLAVAGAAKDSDLEKNIAGHLKNWGRSIQEVRAEATNRTRTHAAGTR